MKHVRAQGRTVPVPAVEIWPFLPVAIGEPDTTAHLALQDGQLPSERGISASPRFGFDGSTSSLRRKMSNAIMVASRYAIPPMDQYGPGFSAHTTPCGMQD